MNLRCRPVALARIAPTLVAAALLLLAGCAAPPDGPRYVLLESESYGCGAAEGLGCGLAIAPVLEQIDALPGVAESSVSWDGHYFRIEMQAGADADRVASDAAALLEGEASCLTAAQGTASSAEPDRWFNAEQTVALSRYEAGVIASGHAAAVAAEVALEPAEVERLRTLMREELERAFEAAHAAGGGVDQLWEQLPEVWPRFEARLSEFLTAEQVAQVGDIVAREIEE